MHNKVENIPNINLSVDGIKPPELWTRVYTTQQIYGEIDTHCMEAYHSANTHSITAVNFTWSS